MVFEQRFAWGRAFRKGRQVCGRVSVTVVRDARLGLVSGEARSHIVARFEKSIEAGFRDELERLARAERPEADRLAERLLPIELVVANHRGRIGIHGCLQPPITRTGPLHELEFRIRERIT